MLNVNYIEKKNYIEQIINFCLQITSIPVTIQFTYSRPNSPNSLELKPLLHQKWP